MPPEITNFELYSIDIWLFVEAVFDGPKNTSQEMILDGYIPSEELLDAINEFNMYHYINMVIDRLLPPSFFMEFDYCLQFLKLPLDTDNSESYIPFKIFPRGTDLTELPEESDVRYISCEKGRIWVDGMRKLGRNLGGRFYSEAAGQRGIRAFTGGRFTGLDEWNSEISMLLDIWPSEEGYYGVSDREQEDYSDWSVDDAGFISSELTAPDTTLEDPEDILDYSRDFPWRLKTPRRERLGSAQSKSAAEPHQPNNDKRPAFHMVRDGLPVVEEGQNREKDEEIVPQSSSEVLIKEMGSEQAQSNRLEDEGPLQQDAYRSPDASEVRPPDDEEQRATGTKRVEAPQPTVTPGWMRYLW
ncbi:hypothetical protein V5O48_005162 [Marasmius crinis-equi]|uniref:Uncharacterized protein n=1 Tax=Marasmius crinis-equi TaxID=585013 RepID=A0ABR3FP27_9AGAR